MQAMMLQSGMVCAADLEAELPMLRDALAEDALEQARGDDALAEARMHSPHRCSILGPSAGTAFASLHCTLLQHQV